MNAHEQLDKFLTATPRVKTITVLSIVGVIAAVLGIVFWLGSKAGDGWAEGRYIKERSENLIKIAKHEANERILAGENEVLKRQNEQIAAERTAKDRNIELFHAQRDEQRKAELQIAVKSIEDQSNAAAVICGTCEASRKAGYPLSAEFCGQCFEQ